MNHPVSQSVSGGDMANTPSIRRGNPPTTMLRKPTTALNNTNPNALRNKFCFVLPGNGCTRVIEPHAVFSTRHSLPPQPDSIACSRYHGSELTTCNSCPSAANSCTMRVITTPVGAMSGAKCGHSTTSRNFLVLTKLHQVHMYMLETNPVLTERQ